MQLTESNLRALADDVLDEAQLSELVARLPKAPFHGTPSGEGGDLDAVGDEQRAQFLKEIAHTPGRALDILGDECKLLRHSGEANHDYRARLKAHVSEPRTVERTVERTVDSFGGRIVLSDSQGVIGEVIADEGDALIDVAQATVAVLEGSLPWPDTWHASPPEYGRLDNPAHVPPNVECITVDQLHTVILQTALHDEHGDSPERSVHVIAWNNALDELAEAARPHFVERPDPQSPSGWDLPDAARLFNPYPGLAAPSAGQPPTLPDGPLFDAEDVARLLVTFADMSEAKARTVVNLYVLPHLAKTASEAGGKSAQESYDHASIAHDHSVAEVQYRTRLAQEVQVAQEAYPDVLETFSRLVGEA